MNQQQIEAIVEQHNPDRELAPIGTVVALLQEQYPDISHSSLRFLEREGLITPARTGGGHRLYSADDLQRIRLIKDWQLQRLSLDQIRQQLTERDATGSPEDLAAQFLDQALSGSLENAQRTILTAYDLGLSLDTLFMSVLRPALWELGDRWQRGEVSVAQEKEVSHVARDLIAELGVRSTSVPDTEHGGRVVAACVPGEQHELGLLMVSGLLRSHGCSVQFLGVDVAPDFLVDAVHRRQPHAVLLSATYDQHLPAMHAAVEAVRTTNVPTCVFAGGQAVERHPERVASWGVTPIRLDDLEQIDHLYDVVLSRASNG
jgi:DNA-binding transcriptional MerR regulator/methylmalonyl-CoA mutase cobalamin-binding subunit